MTRAICKTLKTRVILIINNVMRKHAISSLRHKGQNWCDQETYPEVFVTNLESSCTLRINFVLDEQILTKSGLARNQSEFRNLVIYVINVFTKDCFLQVYRIHDLLRKGPRLLMSITVDYKPSSLNLQIILKPEL